MIRLLVGPVQSFVAASMMPGNFPAASNVERAVDQVATHSDTARCHDALLARHMARRGDDQGSKNKTNADCPDRPRPSS